ncbi:MAG: hypothetical protein ABIG29_00950 [Candidatus Nealsonbacteria bacterium]
MEPRCLSCGSYDYLQAINEIPATPEYSEAFALTVVRMFKEIYGGRSKPDAIKERVSNPCIIYETEFKGKLRSRFLNYLRTESINTSSPVFVIGNCKSSDKAAFRAAVGYAMTKSDPLIFLVLRDEIRESEHLDIGTHFTDKESLIVSVSDDDLIQLAQELKDTLTPDDMIFCHRAGQTIITGEEYLWGPRD